MNIALSDHAWSTWHWATRLQCSIFALALVALVVGQTAIGQEQHPELPIWPKGLPKGAVVFDADKAKELIEATKVHPKGHILFVLAWQHEGVELAEWFNSIGVTAFILKYRVPRRIPDNIHWEPMQDVQRAIRLVRHDAQKYEIDANRIGVLGFSAGGHLAVMSGVQYNTECYDPTDEIDKASARPDFVCPIYAAYLADGYKDDVAELGALVTVTQETPPMFLAVTWGDKMRGAQSALLLSRLKKHNVPAELHVYQNGGHGYGIQQSALPVSNWHHHLAAWLKFNKYFEARDKRKTDETAK